MQYLDSACDNQSVHAPWRTRARAAGGNMQNATRTSQYATEVAGGQRFEFGKNWSWFLDTLNDEKLEEAVASLCDMLETRSLAGETFLDIGSGSGLFSLAARRLGARPLQMQASVVPLVHDRGPEFAPPPSETLAPIPRHQELRGREARDARAPRRGVRQTVSLDARPICSSARFL